MQILSTECCQTTPPLPQAGGAGGGPVSTPLGFLRRQSLNFLHFRSFVKGNAGPLSASLGLAKARAVPASRIRV